MKKLIFGLLFLTLPASAYASSASSTVINNVNVNSTNSNSQVSSHTQITTETNGKVTEYSSDEPNRTIRVESNDDGSKIEVDGHEVSGKDDTNNPDSTPNKTSAGEKNNDEIIIKQRSFLQKLFDQLERPFKIFFLKFRSF